MVEGSRRVGVECSGGLTGAEFVVARVGVLAGRGASQW